jgi:MFS superfamily sulfate permease-like transporter
LRDRTSFGCYLPKLHWAPRYGGSELADDMLAAIIVAIMLIPQALDCALMAGMPAETGPHASLFGTSNTLSVAPVSLLTVAALAQLDLSVVKGLIMDRLATTGFFQSLSGNNYLGHKQVLEDLE